MASKSRSTVQACTTCCATCNSSQTCDRRPRSRGKHAESRHPPLRPAPSAALLPPQPAPLGCAAAPPALQSRPQPAAGSPPRRDPPTCNTADRCHGGSAQRSRLSYQTMLSQAAFEMLYINVGTGMTASLPCPPHQQHRGKHTHLNRSRGVMNPWRPAKTLDAERRRCSSPCTATSLAA